MSHPNAHPTNDSPLSHHYPSSPPENTLLEPSHHPSKTLVELTDATLSSLSCNISSEHDHILITQSKRLSFMRLQHLGFEVGISGCAPRLLINGKGKRVGKTKVHTLTQLIEELRRIHEKTNTTLHYTIQEIAAFAVLKEVLIGALTVTGDRARLGWCPHWRLNDGGFTIGHEISLPRGIGARVMNTRRADLERLVAFLVCHDTMVVFKEEGSSAGTWRLCFVGLDQNVESQQLSIGPDYRKFDLRVARGRMGASHDTPLFSIQNAVLSHNGSEAFDTL